MNSYCINRNNFTTKSISFSDTRTFVACLKIDPEIVSMGFIETTESKKLQYGICYILNVLLFWKLTLPKYKLFPYCC